MEMLKPLLQLMELWFKEQKLEGKSQQIMRSFLPTYIEAAQKSGQTDAFILKILSTYINLLRQLSQNPFAFEPYHKMLQKPFDYYQFGLEFVRPLVNQKASTYLGDENLEEIQGHLKKNENVIFLANHQTEIDPHLIELLLGEKYPLFAKNMIFVAGDRVISDHLAIPLSMGRNLLCIYSKKHINNPPEQKETKRLHNKKTMQLMSELLAEGGKSIYVAPSGGRDRPDSEGEFQVAPFDPQSVEMFYLMTKRSKKPTHFYPLALNTHQVLPPPNDVESELGEERPTKYTGVYAAFGSEINMESDSSSLENKIARRHQRCDAIWKQVAKSYQKLKKIKDQYENDM